MRKEIDEISQKLKNLKQRPILLSESQKNNSLVELAEKLLQSREIILEANQKDLSLAQEQNNSQALIDRLTLNQSRIEGIANSIKKIALLPEITGEEKSWTTSQGLKISKIRVPLGIILIIYEARPNVTLDSLALGIKSNNSLVLRGSRQTKFTNQALAKVSEEILRKYQLQDNFLFLNNLASEETKELLGLETFDLIIPRGGEKLKELVKANAKAPILGAGGGVCQLYVAEKADLNKAARVIYNAKTQRPGVCNALESVLIHRSHLQLETLEKILGKLFQLPESKIFTEKAVLETVNSSFGCFKEIKDAPNGWASEYLNLSLSLKVVDSLKEAIERINFYGTGHSDGIITEDQREKQIFAQLVDSACVYLNTSTRFTDGEVFGFGAEIGISTQKLHARGPISLKELTTYKYILESDGLERI